MKLKNLNLLVITLLLFAVIFMIGCNSTNQSKTADALYKFDDNITTHWASRENIDALKSQGAKENKGAKGAPYYVMQPGESLTLLNTDGAGIIHRIWMTIDDLFHIPEEWRSMTIEMYWDGAETPAVSAPIEDFFGHALGRTVKMENALFASPEARSLVSYIQMPYRTGAKIVVTNESKKRTHRIFFDINFSSMNKIDNDALYFHAHWRREAPTTLGKDFEILPKINGKGRFLGCNIGVIRDQRYIGWWGEGEVKIYLDGDKENPSLCGTGTEDYIGTGWGQGFYIGKYQGSHLVDDEKGLNGFYRYHVLDPVQFNEDCKVTIQQIGGTSRENVKKMIAENLPLKPVFVIVPDKTQYNLLGGKYSMDYEMFSDKNFVGFYRQDDVCATSYFYLNKPTNDLPKLPDFETRNANLGTK